MRGACAAVLAVVVAVSTSAQAASLRLPLQGERLSLPAPAGTPVADYALAYPEGGRWTSVADALEDLRGRAFPEAVELVSADAAGHKLQVRTTAQGRRAFDNAGATITRLTELRPDTPRCAKVYAQPATRGAPAELVVRPGQDCPSAEEVYPERTLVVEGVDGKGRRLFLALSPDSRWEVRESVDDKGRLHKNFEGRSLALPLQVTLVAPVDDRLALLRIWQVDAKGVGRAIADMAWSPKAPR